MAIVNKEAVELKTSLGAALVMFSIVWILSLVNTIYLGYMAFNVNLAEGFKSILYFIFWANLIALLLITAFLIYIAWSYYRKK